ncbi:MAG: glycosyltransferase [Halobacteriovoraceae bacterium]|nr:glycosyltransferase [Halobacteriovoraceae bacterium]
MRQRITPVKFTVILVTYRRWHFLKTCLREIFFQLKTRNDWEILVIVNGEDHKTSLGLKSEFSQVNVLHTPTVSPAQARNILIKKARGEYLCFLDDDSMPGKNYFKMALDFISSAPRVDVFGGPDTVFPDASWFEKVVGMTLLSPMATATTCLRHSIKKQYIVKEGNEEKLILCNLWIKKNIFHKDGYLFDKRFFRNEENILLWHLQKAGKIIKYLPFFYVYHRRKKNLFSVGLAVIGSGRNRLKGFFLYPGSLGLVYFIPMLFVLYLNILPWMDSSVFLWPIVIYIVLLIFFAGKITLQHGRPVFFPHVVFMQFVININYGWAFWMEFFFQVYRKLHKQIFKTYKKQKKTAESNLIV